MRPNSGKGWLGRLMSSRCWRSINEMVIVGKTSFRVREPCPSFYLFGCLYYTIRASRFTRGGGILRRPLQRKQRKHRTFLTLFLYTILKYLFIKILCFRCSWPINGVIKPFVAAQNLHKTCTKPAQNCTELPPAASPPSPIPRIPPKVAPKRATNLLLRHGLTAEYFSWSKPKETTRPICPPAQSGKSVFFCGRNQPGASRSAAQRARKGR